MANSFDSNFTNKLMRVFLEKFESARVLSKNVNTQKLSNAFDPSTGDTVFFKRPTDYLAFENATGDLTSHTADNIITGKASGVVQNYITVLVDFNEADQAIKMDQLDELLAPMATRVVTQLELNFSKFMMKNSGLLAGTYGTAVTTWDHVANFSSVMQAHGIPMDKTWKVAVNPFTQTSLASNQRSLGSGGTSGSLVKTAHEKAMISASFANMDVMSATTLASYTAPAEADAVGIVSSAPTPTYLAAKDTMTQSIAISGIGTSSNVVPAGTVIQITGRNHLNKSTREVIIDGSGANILYTGVVTADVTLSGGAGTLVVSGPGIFEASGSGNGMYNTIDSAISTSDVVTLLGYAASATLFQPNLFWHPEAFSIGSVGIKKLFSTDTLATTEDGLQLRVSKGSSFTKNSQQIRIDLRPAFSVLNPFFAGHGWG